MVLMREAHAAGARFVVYPELALTTFFPRYWMTDQKEIDRFFEREMPGPETRPLFDLAVELGVGFYLGYAELTQEKGEPRHYNTSILVEADGRIIGRYRNVETQQRLAGILLNNKRENLHVIAAQELNRHIQRNGLVLTADQIAQLQQLEQKPEVPAALRTELAAVIGTMRTTPQITGSRLLNYAPEAQAPPEKK